MAEATIGASDGQVYEDTMGHAMDIPMSMGGTKGTYNKETDTWENPKMKPEGSVKIDPKAEEPKEVEQPFEPPNEQAERMFHPVTKEHALHIDPTQLDPFSVLNAQHVQGRAQTAKDVGMAMVPSILKPEEQAAIHQEWQNAKTSMDKAMIVAGVVGQTAMDVAPAAKAAVGAKTLLGLFGGIAGAMARDTTGSLQRLATARMHDVAGADGLEIFRRTGWYKDPIDRQWKEFIPNDKSKLNLEHFWVRDEKGRLQSTFDIKAEEPKVKEPGKDQILSVRDHKINMNYTKDVSNFLSGQGPAAKYSTAGLKLGDIMEHHSLYQRYPWMKDIKIEPLYKQGLKGQLGFNKTTGKYDVIRLADQNKSSMEETLHHEIQHLIQEHEGFSRGASDKASNYWQTAGEIESRIAELWKDVKAKDVRNVPYTPAEDPEIERTIKKYGLPINSQQYPGMKTGTMADINAANENKIKLYVPKTIDESAQADLRDDTQASAWVKHMQEQLEKGKSVKDIAKNLQIPETDIQGFINSYAKQIAEPEKIEEAAIRVGGQKGTVHTGQMHFDALEKALKSGVPLKDAYQSEQGYMTNRGNFLTREQATDFMDKKRPKDLASKEEDNVTRFIPNRNQYKEPIEHANDNKESRELEAPDLDFYLQKLKAAQPKKEFAGADRNKYPLTYQTKDEDVYSKLKKKTKFLDEQAKAWLEQGYEPGMFKKEFSQAVGTQEELERRLKDIRGSQYQEFRHFMDNATPEEKEAYFNKDTKILDQLVSTSDEALEQLKKIDELHITHMAEMNAAMKHIDSLKGNPSEEFELNRLMKATTSTKAKQIYEDRLRQMKIKWKDLPPDKDK